MIQRKELVLRSLAVVLTWCLVAGPSAMALDLHGFADISYRQDVRDSAAPEENNGAFAVGALDFYIAESLGPRVDMLAEFELKSGAVDVERLQIGYLFSDSLKVYAGRFHTSLGYWNTAYHHGAFLYSTINRPYFLKFDHDGGLLPVHTVGLVLTGRQFLEVGEFSYHIYMGNGPSIMDENGANMIDPNNAVDPNKNKAVGARITWTPSALTGWAVGVSAFNSEVVNNGPLVSPPAPAPDLDVTQTIVGADLSHTEGLWEVLAEYFLVKDKDNVGAKTATNHFYYVQVGREFGGRVMPYARHEQGSIEEGANDPYMLALSAADRRIETIGVKTRLGEQSVLKLEGRFVNDDGVDSHQEYGAQWAFAF